MAVADRHPAAVATRRATLDWWVLRRIDAAAVSTWALVGGLVLYLAIDGGGYDIVVHSQVAIIVWWLVLLGATWGFLPVARTSRVGWAGLGLFGGFVAWTAVASTWSLSSERSLQSLSLVAGYLGVLVLGLAVHRDRERALRQTMEAIACAIVLVAILAVLSRLRPGLFHSAGQTASFLGGTQARLNWPLNYWNALAALMVLGLPLLLALATSARSLRAQAAAAGGVPILALCVYLTFSRGGELASGVALIAFIALAPERIPKLATVLTAAAGSAVLIAGAVHRGAVEHGFTGAAARTQGTSLLITTAIVCTGVALAQGGIGLAVRHAQPPSWLVISRGAARRLLAVGMVLAFIAVLDLVASGKVSHEWRQFQDSHSAQVATDSLQRFGVVSGNGRYDLWKVAVNATSGHVLAGSGPGTFQLLWLPRATYAVYVENAHSLYFETLAEEGVAGLALLAGFLLLVVAAAVRLVIRSRDAARTRGAGAAAALLAFMVSAGFDWMWQVPVLPAVFMLLAAAVLAPAVRGRSEDGAAIRAPRRLTRWGVRGGAIVLAVASLVAIAIPLAMTNAERSSQAAAASHDYAAALVDARAAHRVQPGAASPQVQIALVLEAQGHPRAALVAARRAASDESDWSTWLIVSRLEAETGQPVASVSAYHRARSLNPRSAVFTQ
jgi:hypothetical protein